MKMLIPHVKHNRLDCLKRNGHLLFAFNKKY